jgi:uncharacterized membrane protein YhaH (DUF805 family)
MWQAFWFNGRIGRARYVGGGLLAGGAAAAALSALNLHPAGAATPVLGVILVVLGALGAWVSLCLGAQRLHDRGRAGWLIALPAAAALLAFLVQTSLRLTGVGPIVLFAPAAGLGLWLAAETLLLRGDEDENRYGPNPLVGRVARCSDCGEALPGHKNWCPGHAVGARRASGGLL